jgi:hypothetical protein
MASLHHAAGSPVAFDQRVLSTNPFLKSEPVPARLPPADGALPAAEAIEVTVLWGTNVLAVEQLSPPRKFAVGEVGGAGGAGTSAAGDVDFALSADALGSARCEIIAIRAGVPVAVFDATATPRVLEKGRAVDASAITIDCSDVALGARGIELRQERVVMVERSGVTFRLAGIEKPDRVPRVLLGGAERSSLTTMGTAAVLQGLLVATLAYLTPSLADASEAELDHDRLILMQQYLDASAERSREQEQQAADDTGGQKGAPAEGAKGPEGKAGKPEVAAQNKRMGIQGDSAQRIVGRAELRAEAENFGTIGLLNQLNASSAPSSPWGAELSMGPDSANGTGDMWSDQIGDVTGHGLGVSGTERGGGGPGAGIGVGAIGTCMGINCYGNGDGGFGRSVGRNKPDRTTGVPSVRMATDSTVSGRLPKDVIQRIVRQNYGRFRNCYEMGLRTNPNLEGRVVARFVIGRDGAVSNVSASGDVPDAAVKSCVASAFYGLSFPSPDNGIVTVSYPIMLTPG